MKQSVLSADRRYVYAVCVVVFLVGLGVYAFAINLPFRIDDFVQFRLLRSHTLLQVWFNQAGLAYYRPLQYTVWKVVDMVSGAYPVAIINGINIVCHALNAVLIFYLIYLHQSRTLKATVIGTASAILFLVFPFSYQAIPWAGALSHPLVMLLMLGGMLCATLAYENHSRSLWVVSLVLAILGPFAHETGVLMAAGFSVYTVTANNSPPFRRLAKKIAPFWIISILVAIFMLVVRMSAGTGTPSLEFESRLQNGAYFLQGLAYPIAPLARNMIGLLPGLNDIGAILLTCIPVMIALSYIYLRLGQGRLTTFALGWYFIMIAPAWLLLPFSYVVDGPRLMYEASPAAALFWVLPVSIVVDRWHTIKAPIQRVAALAVAVVAVGVTLYTSGVFLSERADMYEQTRLASVGLLRAAVQPDTDPRNLLSVNFPAWIAPKTPTFALGHEGVSFIPEYSSPIDLVWTMTGVDKPMYNVVVTELQSHWRYNYLNYGARWTTADLQPQLRIARHVLFTSYRSNDLVTFSAGSLEAEKIPKDTSYLGSFDNQLAVRKGEWQLIPDGLLTTLHWQSWLTLTQEVRTFVHLQAATDGIMIAQEDGLPLMGLSNPLWWQPGDVWADTRLLVLPPDLKPGTYTLTVGVYPVNGGPRLEAKDQAGKRLQDDAVILGTIVIPPKP